MRLLHTSDWHLGKILEGVKNSRLDEQQMFIEELLNIIEEKNIDMVLIAGDIYDNGNPPARAEKLFYDTLKRMSNEGKRAVVVISGNHDNPERLVAAAPLAAEHGIVMFGTPKASIEPNKYGEFEIINSGEGWIEIELKGEKAVVLALPYPSEKRLNEVLLQKDSQEERKLSYSERVGELFESLATHYREDTINIALSHIYITGGDSSDSERNIELGGTLAVTPEALPKGAQYIALGHLHRPQKVKGSYGKAYYSGSPIQYSKSEVGYSKCVYVIDVKPGEEAVIEEVYLSNYKPIEVWRCKGVVEAIELCKENSNRNVWVYLEIETDEYISQENIKQMHEYKKDIVEIVPKIKGLVEEMEHEFSLAERNIEDLFKEFYASIRGTEPSDEIMTMFNEIAYEVENGEE